jgi:hypothetical protein
VERVFAYLHKSKGLGITYSCGLQESDPFLYVDSSFGDPQLDYKGTTGWVAMWMGGPISCKFKKQTIQSQSTAEAEIIAAADAMKEAKYLRMLFEDFELCPNEATFICEVNEAAIAYSLGEGTPQRLRHLDKDNVADMLTKALSAGPLNALRAQVLQPLSSA